MKIVNLNFNKNKKQEIFSCTFFPKNCRGDIPTTILVIGVILVCGLAIFSFFASTIKMRNSFVGVGLMQKMKFQIEDKIFNNENPAGLYLEKNETRGILFDRKEALVFSVEYQGNP